MNTPLSPITTYAPHDHGGACIAQHHQHGEVSLITLNASELEGLRRVVHPVPASRWSLGAIALGFLLGMAFTLCLSHLT